MASLGATLANAQNYDGPTSGTLVAEKGGLLDFQCVQSGPDQASCDFVQVLFSRNEPLQNTSDDYKKFISDTKKIEATCKMSEQFELYMSGASIDAEAGAAPFQELSANEQEKLRNLANLIGKFCATKSEEDFRNLINYSNSSSQKQCISMVNRYTQNYRRINDEMWVIASEPSGLCGVINTSHFKKDPKFDFLWTHSASKLVKNKEGTTEFGIACVDLDESVIEYSATKSIQLDCETLQ